VPPGHTSQFFVQIISLEENIRSKKLAPRLTKFGLDFQISPGIVPNKTDFHAGSLHSPFLYRLLSQRTATIGEIGAALAHRVAMSSFLNSNHKFGIIFEDDAEVVSEFNLDIVADLLDSDLPIIIAIGWIPGFTVSKDPQILPSEEMIELITAPIGAFAYAINRPAAKFMVAGHERIIDTVDWPVYSLNKVKFYATRRSWVTTDHDPEFSTIGVRSSPVSKNPVAILVSRIRLLSFLVTLVLLSRTKKLRVSPKQIVHQLVIRGFLHRYGVRQISESLLTNEVIPLPLKYQRMLKSLNLD
jgi:GR25 family glycosyltransferase involved in LPS biosynthesis